MTKGADDLIQFEQKLDALLSSDMARQNALNGEDVLLRTAARLTAGKHPILAPHTRQRIASQVTQIVPVAGGVNTSSVVSFGLWLSSIAALIVVVVGIGWTLQQNPQLPADNGETIIITPEVNEALTDEPERIVSTLEVTEAPTDEPLPIAITPEVTNEPSDEPSPIVIPPEVTDEPAYEPQPVESDQPVFSPYTLYITPNGRVNVREGAGTSYAVLGVANQNTPVMVLAHQGSWREIRLPNGLQGWVSADLLSDRPGNATGQGNGRGSDDNAGDGNVNDNANPPDTVPGRANGNATGNANGNSGSRP
ncbi:MAG: SH3 domain-containing protein [Anaerolineae bacterium]